MVNNLPFMKELLSVPGISGHEAPAREIILKEWKPLADEITISRLGSVHALKKGSGEGPRPSIMLAGHMDAIGMMVTKIVDGFLRFTRVGGVDPRVLPGQAVYVHGRETLPGIVAQPRATQLPPHLGGDKPVPMEYLWVDVGLPAEEVEKMVRVGDLISYAQPPVELSGETLAGHTLDDRAAVLSITYCLQHLQKRVHHWDVWAVATVQEETGFEGAFTSSFGLNPDLGVAIDVTHAKGPGTSEARISTLGKGVVLDMGPNGHPYLFKTFKELADEIEIPYQVNVGPGHSGTDAYAIQVAQCGKPTMVISIPLRYMHTPVELVSLKDIKRVGRLLAEFITNLDENYLQEISWDF